jgi:hypothetical protein
MTPAGNTPGRGRSQGRLAVVAVVGRVGLRGFLRGGFGRDRVLCGLEVLGGGLRLDPGRVLDEAGRGSAELHSDQRAGFVFRRGHHLVGGGLRGTDDGCEKGCELLLVHGVLLREWGGGGRSCRPRLIWCCDASSGVKSASLGGRGGRRGVPIETDESGDNEESGDGGGLRHTALLRGGCPG